MRYGIILIFFIMGTLVQVHAHKSCHGLSLGAAFWVVLSQHDKACARAVSQDLKNKKPGNPWYGSFQRVQISDRHKLLKLLGDISMGRALQNSTVSDLETLLIRYFPKPKDIGQVHKSLADTPLQKQMLVEAEKHRLLQHPKSKKKLSKGVHSLTPTISPIQLPKQSMPSLSTV